MFSSEAQYAVWAAEALWLADASLERIGRAGDTWSAVLLAKLRAILRFATTLCVRAVDRLALAVGAHGMLDDTRCNVRFGTCTRSPTTAPTTGTSWPFHLLVTCSASGIHVRERPRLAPTYTESARLAIVWRSQA
ncbi:MAG: hypothetical protein JOZ87_09275 [Chloroflexi bacterium]|nr:hypothetical protein [Chloroflexota bacterium]